MAWAVESSFDTYEITDDVGIMPLSDVSEIIDFDYSLFQYSLDILRSFVNNHQHLGKHYVVFVDYSDIFTESSMTEPGALLYWVFFFDDYTVNSNGEIVVLDRNDGIPGFRLSFYSSNKAVVRSFGRVYSLDNPITQQLIFSNSRNLARYFNGGFPYLIPNFSSNVSFSPYSDLPGFVDISNRGEVLAQYATVFSLAVFLVLDVLRGFWRSFRGRDT